MPRKVIITAVGPYKIYGSKLVAACARAGVHHCDLTGESLWVKDMIDKHHDEAERTGAKILPSCGFDSIPAVSAVVSFFSPQVNPMSLQTATWYRETGWVCLIIASPNIQHRENGAKVMSSP